MTAPAATPARRGLTEQAADTAIDQACRMLRLPTIRSHFTETADTAARQQQSYRAFLAELLLAECEDRARRRSERRIRAAAFPREKSLRSFDYDANIDEASRQLTGQDSSPGYVRRALQQSLSRLGTDYLDVYLLHLSGLEPQRAAGLLETLQQLRGRWHGFGPGPQFWCPCPGRAPFSRRTRTRRRSSTGR